MTPRSPIAVRLLAALCVLEGLVILFLLARQSDVYPLIMGIEPEAKPVAVAAATKTAPVFPAAPAAKPPGPAELPQKYAALEKEYAALKQELDVRRSEISFSYGTLRDSGRFVGMTFRKMFEAAAARGVEEAQARLADNQINVLSLGPHIQDAEVMESDPGSFAQFQTALLGEVLELPAERRGEIEALLTELKTQSLRAEMGSPEWLQLNDTALARITGLLSPTRQQALQPQLEFLQRYGVLMIPAYSILRAPTPTVVPTPGSR